VVTCVLMWTANRNVSVAVNSSTALRCLLDCTSNISWSYMPFGADSRTFFPLEETQCVKNGRCRVENFGNREIGRSLLHIGQVQITDTGTYLCSAGTSDHRDHCEISFNFTGRPTCMPMPIITSQPGGVRNIVMSICLSVCLSVCLSTRITRFKTAWPNFTKFLCML